MGRGGSDKRFEYKMVIVARSDLKLSAGKLAAQVAHAAVNCALYAKAHKKTWFSRWYSEGQKKVVLKVDGVEELRELQAVARAQDLPVSMVVDAGMTEIPPGTITCLGIGPGPDAIVNNVTGSLPLLR